MKHLTLAVVAVGLIFTFGCSDDDGDNSMGPEMGVAPDSGCSAPSSQRCVDGHPTAIDSCGRVGDRVETCRDEQICLDGACACPDGVGEIGCRGDDVYRFDTCGDPSYMVTACGATETCREGACVPVGCEPSDEMCDGEDNDCDGTVDEGDLCAGGVQCIAGICGAPGGLCSPCERNEDCQQAHTCAGYANYPEQGRVCVPTGCTDDSQCPANTRCNDDGICWLQWRQECRDNASWNIDTCGRAVSVSETCDDDSPCQMGRCVGAGELCDECNGNGQCAIGYRCRSYSNYEHLPSVCVPESDCNEPGGDACPDGLQCSSGGVCWLTWTSTCLEDGDPWQIDTCGRQVVRAEECGLEANCNDGRCIGSGQSCDECTQNRDCAAGFVCRGYSNYPEVSQVCVPESDCAENPDSVCPDGFQCGMSGVCWLTWQDGCGDDPNAVYNVDNCGRAISVQEECAEGNQCNDGACEPSPIDADGGAPEVIDAGVPAPEDPDAGIPIPAPDAGS